MLHLQPVGSCAKVKTIMNNPLVFTGNSFDRASHLRGDTNWLAEQQQKSDSRWLPMHRLKALINLGEGVEICWRPYEEVKSFVENGATVIFLGILDGVSHFAVDTSELENPKAPPFDSWGKFIDVRSISAQLNSHEAGALAQARSMIAWHNNHMFCSVCGHPSKLQEAGYSRKCSSEDCNGLHFPRTDPVAIMMVIKDDKCLLGYGPHFPKEQYSALAGFIEPGETIEQGVRREIFEETGVEVGGVTYHSSQPWPYPSSLMIGCFAEALSEEITLDPKELAHAGWFTKNEVREMLAKSLTRETPRMSPPLAIAHQLAKSWVETD